MHIYLLVFLELSSASNTHGSFWSTDPLNSNSLTYDSMKQFCGEYLIYTPHLQINMFSRILLLVHCIATATITAYAINRIGGPSTEAFA